MKEKRQYFNLNCQPTGKFYFEGESMAEGLYPVVVMIAIENNRGEFLLQRRSKLKSSPLTWAVTGGHPRFNETNLQAIKREVKEEIGLDIENEVLSSFWFGFDGRVCREMFYCKKDIDLNNLILQTEEVDAVCWFSKDQVLTMIEDKQLSQNQVFFFNNLFTWKEQQKREP